MINCIVAPSFEPTQGRHLTIMTQGSAMMVSWLLEIESRTCIGGSAEDGGVEAMPIN
jgi:hypothetical protein